MGHSMHRLYVAGAYSADNVLDVLSNMRRGIALTLEAIRAGYAPFCPWLDFQYGLIADLPLESYYALGMAWLECADAVLVVPEGAATSSGTQAELRRARELGVPIVYGHPGWAGEMARVLSGASRR